MNTSSSPVATVRNTRPPRIFEIILLVLAVALATARGGVVSWTAFDWPDPNQDPVLTNTTAGVDGGDVTWEFRGDTANFNGSSPNNTTDLTGGTGNATLLWRWNPDVQSQQITLDIQFTHPEGVRDVTLQLHDIDAARKEPKKPEKKDPGTEWGDRVTITATDPDGGTVNPTFQSLGASVQASGNSLVGVDKSNANQTKGGALVTIASAITKITLVFQDKGSSAFEPGSTLDIGVGDLTFTPVPEPSAPLALLLLSMAVPLIRHRRLGR